jgi:RNA polymerase sigma factor for flagellar operon FliA
MRAKQTDPQHEAELAAKYLYLAQHVAAKLASRCSQWDYDHIESAAQVGLLRAIRSHQPEHGKITTWIVQCCNSEMLSAVRELDYLSKTLRRKSNSRQTAIDYLTQQMQHPPTDEDLEAAGMTHSEPAHLCQLDDEREPRARPTRCTIAEAEAFREATKGLSLLEQTVLYLYFYQDVTQKSIATVLGVGEARLSQIMQEIMKKLRQSNFFQALYDNLAEK